MFRTTPFYTYFICNINLYTWNLFLKMLLEKKKEGNVSVEVTLKYLIVNAFYIKKTKKQHLHKYVIHV